MAKPQLPKDHADSPEGRAAAGLDKVPRNPARAIARPNRRERRAIDKFHKLFYERRAAYKATHFLGTRLYKCPLDLWVYQELVYELQPDLVVETGTLHGGSALFFGCMLDLTGRGEVLSIDLAKRRGLPEHPRVTYLHGSSTAPEIIDEVHGRADNADTVMVVLDSDHRRDHVLAELQAYGPSSHQAATSS